jgi:symplekin
MQLPREQLKEILDKQPEMKPGLWQYVLAKNGPVKAQAYADVSNGTGLKISASTY